MDRIELRNDRPSDRDASTASPPSRPRRFFAHPLVWMPIGVLAIAAAAAICSILGSTLGPAGAIGGGLLSAALTIAIYRTGVHRLAGRATPELPFAWRRAGIRALAGAGVGAGFMVVSVTLVVLLGGYTLAWHPLDPVVTVAAAITVSLGAAVVEELIFRGLVFRAIEQLAGRRVVLGRVLALGLTSIFFGVAHLLNPAATLWSGLAIAIEAGFLLGAAFLWTRSLWFVIGLHTAWNAIEGMLGIAVSGHRDPGLFVTTTHGPALLTGGEFGLDASLVPVLVSLAIAIPMLVASARRASR